MSETNRIIKFDTQGVIDESNLPKVPEGWQVFWSAEQRKPFYVPPNNSQSQWDHPNKHYAWELYRDKNNEDYLYNNLTHEFIYKDIPNPSYYWKKIIDKTGREFYYNTVMEQTQWEVPFKQPLDTTQNINAHYQRQLSTPTLQPPSLQPPSEEVEGQVEKDLLRAESAQNPNVEGEVYTVDSQRGKPRALVETADQRAKNLLESEKNKRNTFLTTEANLNENKKSVLLHTWGIMGQSSHSSVVKTFIHAIRANNKEIFDKIYNKYSKKVCGGYLFFNKRHSCIQDIINPYFMNKEIGKNDTDFLDWPLIECVKFYIQRPDENLYMLRIIAFTPGINPNVHYRIRK